MTVLNVGDYLYRAEFNRDGTIKMLTYRVQWVSRADEYGYVPEEHFDPKRIEPYHLNMRYISRLGRVCATKEDALKRLEARTRAEAKRLEKKLNETLKRLQHVHIEANGLCRTCRGSGNGFRRDYGLYDPCEVCNGAGKRVAG